MALALRIMRERVQVRRGSRSEGMRGDGLGLAAIVRFMDARVRW